MAKDKYISEGCSAARAISQVELASKAIAESPCATDKNKEIRYLELAGRPSRIRLRINNLKFFIG
jgi:hypothetical protein